MCHKKIKRPADLSIEEGTLSAALFRVKQRCGKVDDFLHFLPFAKEHGLWIPIDSVFDLGTPGRSSLTHFSIDALDDSITNSRESDELANAFWFLRPFSSKRQSRAPLIIFQQKLW